MILKRYVVTPQGYKHYNQHYTWNERQQRYIRVDEYTYWYRVIYRRAIAQSYSYYKQYGTLE